MSIVNLRNSRASSQIDNFRLHVDSDAPGEQQKNEICSTRAFKFECKWLLTAHRAKFNREIQRVLLWTIWPAGLLVTCYIPNLNEHRIYNSCVACHSSGFHFFLAFRFRVHRVRIFVLHVVLTLSDVCHRVPNTFAEIMNTSNCGRRLFVIAVKIYKYPRGLSSSTCQWPQMKALLPNEMMRSTLTHNQCHSMPNDRFYRKNHTWLATAGFRIVGHPKNHSDIRD